MVNYFVLRKGAIESYYKHVSNTTYCDKPSAAVEEIAGLEENNTTIFEDCYKDIVSALKFIAITKVIDESFAVRKELLSELALVLGVLNKDSTEKEILATIKQAKNSSLSLFEYKIICENDKMGVEITLQSSAIDVDGFPFKIYCGQNVNEVVSMNVIKI